MVEHADVVFIGRVVGVEDITKIDAKLLGEVFDEAIPVEDARLSFPHYGEVTFAVEGVYKGETSRLQVVDGHGSEVSCQYEFEQGQLYTVFASRVEPGILITGLCEGTTEGRIDPAEFGFGKQRPPDPGVDHNRLPNGSWIWLLGLILFTPPVAAVVLLIILFRSYRRDRERRAV